MTFVFEEFKVRICHCHVWFLPREGTKADRSIQWCKRRTPLVHHHVPHQNWKIDWFEGYRKYGMYKYIYICIFIFYLSIYLSLVSILYFQTHLHGFLPGYASMPPSILSQLYFPLELVAPARRKASVETPSAQWLRLLVGSLGSALARCLCPSLFDIICFHQGYVSHRIVW